MTNTATASAGGTTSNTDSVTVTATQNRVLTLDKTTTTTSYAAVGAVLRYSYLVSNSGNVRLAGPVTLADDKAADEACPNVNTVGNLDTYLDRGKSLTCSATYAGHASRSE